MVLESVHSSHSSKPLKEENECCKQENSLKKPECVRKTKHNWHPTELLGKETTHHCRGAHTPHSSGYGASYHRWKIQIWPPGAASGIWKVLRLIEKLLVTEMMSQPRAIALVAFVSVLKRLVPKTSRLRLRLSQDGDSLSLSVLAKRTHGQWVIYFDEALIETALHSAGTVGSDWCLRPTSGPDFPGTWAFLIDDTVHFNSLTSTFFHLGADSRGSSWTFTCAIAGAPSVLTPDSWSQG